MNIPTGQKTIVIAKTVILSRFNRALGWRFTTNKARNIPMAKNINVGTNQNRKAFKAAIWA